MSKKKKPKNKNKNKLVEKENKPKNIPSSKTGRTDWAQSMSAGAVLGIL